MTEERTFHYGRIEVLVPDDCPHPDFFELAVRRELHQTFGSPAAAEAACRAYDGCQEVPAEFRGNRKATELMQQAQLAASYEAVRWENFCDWLNGEFQDFDEEGRDKEPLIPGWSPVATIAIGMPAPRAPAPDPRLRVVEPAANRHPPPAPLRERTDNPMRFFARPRGRGRDR